MKEEAIVPENKETKSKKDKEEKKKKKVESSNITVALNDTSYKDMVALADRPKRRSSKKLDGGIVLILK